jgi:plasmid stabilization system protein ParE
MTSYEISPEALGDLLSIEEFVSADNPPAAERLTDKFFQAFEHLQKWPRSGHSRTDLTSKPVLFWPVGSYLVVYRLREADSKLQIVAVLVGARDVPAVLKRR